MADVQTKTLAEIGTIVTGKTPSTSHREYYDGDYMFITPSELHGDYIVTSSAKTITDRGMQSIRSNTIDGDSVLVGCIGWDMGNVAMCKSHCATNQQINSITNIVGYVNPAYLYYWLSTKKEYLFSIASVTRTPILSKSVFEQIEVPLPTRHQQDEIVSVLESIDKAIMLNNRINECLRAMLATLYGYWFNQFDFPDTAGKPYRSSGGKMVWNERLKREIPENWSVASIIDNPLTEVIRPGVAPFEEKIYLATADVNGTNIGAGNPIQFENRESRANMEPTLLSVWFAKMKASVKHLCFSESMKRIAETSILSTGFLGLQCTIPSFEYIASFVSSPFFEAMKDQLAHGATQEAVNNDDLRFIPLLVPEKRVLMACHEKTTQVYSLIGSNIVENKSLASLRDWLLPMLMNGQATVKS